MSLNKDATIKIKSIIETLEREQQMIYHYYFKATDEQLINIADSIDKDLQTYFYIYQLIIKDTDKN